MQIDPDLRLYSGSGGSRYDSDHSLILTRPCVRQEIPEAIRESPKEPIRNYRLFCGFEKILTDINSKKELKMRKNKAIAILNSIEGDVLITRKDTYTDGWYCISGFVSEISDNYVEIYDEGEIKCVSFDKILEIEPIKKP